MDELLELLKKWNDLNKETMSFQIFLDESGSIYSHCVGEEMKEYHWQHHFTSIEDACQTMKIKLAGI